MTRPKSHSLSEAQLEIMELVWDRGEVTVAEVWEELSRRRHVARNTVQTLISRLQEKGWLKHRVSGRSHVYSSAQPREKTLGSSVRHLIDTLFRGSAEELMTTLLESESLAPDEADRIRAMIDEAQKRSARRRRKS